MKLMHYSDKPIRKVVQKHWYYGDIQHKPRGFWVSVFGDDDWPSWCGSEGFRLDTFQFHYQVSLRKDARILKIRTRNQLVQFSNEYGMRYPVLRGWEMSPMLRNYVVNRKDVINWKRLFPVYQGIIIAPYYWQERLGDHMWYYPWDCASGCIWDTKAIRGIKLVRRVFMRNEPEQTELEIS